MNTPTLQSRQSFKKALIARFLVRFHMSLILGGCFLGGVIANKLFLLVNITAMPIRYALAVLAAYLVFFLLVRLWLLYVSRQKRDLDFNIDIPDPRLPKADSGSHSTETFQGHGGDFGGGGARGSWSGASSDSHSTPTLAVDREPVPLDSAADVSHGGFDFGFDLDEGAAIVLIVFAAVIAVLLGAGLYLIYDAPAILTDAAFEATLSAGLFKSLQRIDKPNWIGNVFQNTWKPFAITAGLAVLFSTFVHFYCPGAHTLQDLYYICFKP